MGYSIVTRYHGPANYRGSRVIGTGPAPHLPEPGERRTIRATVSWDYGAGNGPALAVTRPDGSCNVSGCYRADRTHDVAAHREQDAQHDRLPYGGAYAGWGDADANHRRAADAVVAQLRAAGWAVTLAPEDRGAMLPDDSGRVFILEYGRE